MKHRRTPRYTLEAAFARASRETARARQDSKCLYCRDRLTAETATREHRVPRSLGGSDRQENIGASCQCCNLTKGSTPEGKFKNIIKHPQHGDSVHVWLAWSRRRINLAVERSEKRIGAAMGWV